MQHRNIMSKDRRNIGTLIHVIKKHIIQTYLCCQPHGYRGQIMINYYS